MPDNGTQPRGSARAWRTVVFAATWLIFAALCFAAVALNAYENRPRESACRRNMEKIKRIVGEFINEDPTVQLPEREGNALLTSLAHKTERYPDLFICPFTGTPRGGCDYEGWDFSRKMETFYGSMILWEKKSSHGGGRYAALCDGDGTLHVEFLKEDDFKAKLAELERKKLESASGGARK